MLAHKKVATLKGRSLRRPGLKSWAVSLGISWRHTGSWEFHLKVVELHTQIGAVYRLICELCGLCVWRTGGTSTHAVHLWCGWPTVAHRDAFGINWKNSDICDGLCGRKERGTLWCHLGRVFEWGLLQVLCLKLVARSFKFSSCTSSEVWYGWAGELYTRPHDPHSWEAALYIFFSSFSGGQKVTDQTDWVQS